MERQMDSMQPQLEEMQITQVVKPIGENEIAEAERLLMEYKAGKANFDRRIKETDNWWRMRHFEVMDREEFGDEVPSAWLFNSIASKHAAMMENYPEPNILPREQADEHEAKMLSAIIPVVLEHNDFKETYSRTQWRKMQNGNGLIGVYWSPEKLNGLGDINIVPINILNFFWEPGVRDIQLSKNIFNVELVDEDDLRAQYPDVDLGTSNSGFSLEKFMTEDYVDETHKRLLVDWYYKRRVGGKTELHLCKFVAGTLLYSSENEGKPWYDDGQYPFVPDVFYPMEGSPFGFGTVDVGKHAQKQVDELNQAIITNAKMNCRPRYFQANNATINEQEFADWRKQIVHVDGMLDEVSVQEIPHRGMDGIYMNVLDQKINELKETTSNNDVMTGAGTGGSTAASAIMAQQEKAGMTLKDATRGSYRAYEELIRMVISRIRQFYDAPRTFRIIGEMGDPEFVSYDNHNLKPIPLGMGPDGVDQGYRMPEFDIEVVAQAESQYTKLKNNEDIINLFNLGFFNPENVDVSLMVLDVLDMPRKDKIIQHLKQYKTVHDKMAEYAQLAMGLAGKYEPQLAQGLTQQVQLDLSGGDAANMQQLMQMPAPQLAGPQEPNGQQPIQSGRWAKVREQAQDTTRPGGV